MDNGGDWDLGSKSGLVGTVLHMSNSTDSFRVGELFRVGGVQPPAIGELEVWHSDDVGESSKGFHSVLALLICGLSSTEEFCIDKFYVSQITALGLKNLKTRILYSINNHLENFKYMCNYHRRAQACASLRSR